jgi:hypothetical protein
MMKGMIFFLCMISLLAKAQPKNVTVRILQDQSYSLDEYETEITLEKSSMKIQVFLENIEGVYCFASFDDSLHKLSATDTVPGFFYLPENTMAEEQYNKDKELLVSNDGWCYWFYNPKDAWHRFNKKVIDLEGGKYVGTKSIKQFYLVEDDMEVKIKDNNRPLYLFFVAVTETDKEQHPIKELLRRKVKINWVNDKD